MSTKVKTATSANIAQVNYGQMWAFWIPESNIPAYNPGRDTKGSWGNPTAQIPPGMESGYDLSKGSMVAIDVDTAKTIFTQLAENTSNETRKALYAAIAANPAKVAMEQRKQRAAELRKEGDKTTAYRYSNPKKPSDDIAVEVSNRHVADVLDSFAKIEPTLFVVCGQRRFYAGGHTLALSEKRHDTSPVDYQWFVSVKEFDNVSALHETVLQENQQNERQPYSDEGLLQNAISLLDEQPLLGETDLGRILGLADIPGPNGKPEKSLRGKRQQIRRAAAVALMLPELQIGERVDMDETRYADSHDTKAGKLKYVKGNYIPLAKLHKEDMACMLGERKDATDAIKAIWPDYTKGSKATPQIFEKYVRMVIDGEKPRGALTPKELSKYVDIARIKDATAKVGDVLTAIIAGNADYFNTLNK